MNRPNQRNDRIDFVNDLADKHPALIACLQAAVPLRILELAALPPLVRERRRLAWAAAAVDEVAYKGDTFQYGSKRRGEAAEIFNDVARALAAGAYQPGGITAFGEHWCVEHGLCEQTNPDPSGVTA